MLLDVSITNCYLSETYSKKVYNKISGIFSSIEASRVRSISRFNNHGYTTSILNDLIYSKHEETR